MLTDLILSYIRKDPTIKRHLVKTVSWRIVGSVDTIIISSFIAHNWQLGFTIGGIEFFTKMFLYFWHERIWLQIAYGLPDRILKALKIKESQKKQLFLQDLGVAKTNREVNNQHRAITIWLTGLSASGKSSIASALDKQLFTLQVRSFVLDGDNTRIGINSDLSFSKEDRKENIRRVAEICKLFNEAGSIAIASFISPFAADRQMAKTIIGEENFIEVYIDTPIAVCKQRDRKGLYPLAEKGKIKQFTGISSPYEAPTHPDIRIHNAETTITQATAQILEYLESQFHIVISSAHVTGAIEMGK
jgi:adenylylsulfate kinase